MLEEILFFFQIWFKTFEKNNINDINFCLQIPNEVELYVKPFSKSKNEGGYFKKNYNNFNKGRRYYK